jgi:glutamate racemase
VKLIDPAVHVVAACAKELDLLGLKNTYPALPTRFIVSGCPRQFAESSAQWLGFTPMAEVVCLSNTAVSSN